MALSDALIKKFVKSTPSGYADIIMDFIEAGHKDEADLLKAALNAYNKFQNIVRYGGNKEERDEHMADYNAYMVELIERLFVKPNTVVSSKVFSVLNKTLNETTKIMNESKKEIDLKPTSAMSRAAQRGFNLVDKFGTEVDTRILEMAQSIINNEPLSADEVKHLHLTFLKNEIHKKTSGWRKQDENYPSKGLITWLLHGGDSGFAWTKLKKEQLEKREASISKLLSEENPIINEAGKTSILVFSSDVMDYYNNDLDELVQDYIAAADFSDEEIATMDKKDLENSAVDWAYNWPSNDFHSEEKYYMDYFDKMFDKFIINIVFSNWRGRSSVNTEKTPHLQSWYETMKISYRGLDNIAVYIKNGKLVIEFRHHDATDVAEVTGYINGKPKRFTLE